MLISRKLANQIVNAMTVVMFVGRSTTVAAHLNQSVQTSIANYHHQTTVACNDELFKECHCGSIATSPSTSLFTRIAYPNSTIVIEEYDEEIPYGYKYLRVYYRCTDDKDVLVGDNMRECSNGNWLGPVPRCAINNLNRTKLKHIRITDYKLNLETQKQTTNETNDQSISLLIYYDESLLLNTNGAFEIPLQNQPNECLRWSLSPKQTWSIKLNNQTKVHYVRIKLYGNHIEDLYLNHEIKIDMSLQNISFLESIKENAEFNFVSLPIEIKCRETVPKASPFETYQQKYSPNYLVLDFMCEIDHKEKSIFEFLFSNDYDVDQLFVNTIEVRFQMLKLLAEPSVADSGLELVRVAKQKIIVISLCELKLYSFDSDCGQPDIPVTTIVQRDFNYFYEPASHKSYKYICLDKNQVIKGSEKIECGYYGKWKTDFPQCVPSSPCDKLTNMTVNSDYKLNVKYEMLITNKKTGKKVIPNGKSARFSCTKVNQTISDMLNSSATNSSRYIHGMSQIICQNGEWIGLESANPNCITKPKRKANEMKSMESPATKKTRGRESNEVVSLPVRVIKILFALFVILCLIIVVLLIYMCIFRKRMSRVNSVKENNGMMNPFDLDSIIPTITYDSDLSDFSGAVYSSVNEYYDRISLDPGRDRGDGGRSEGHVYYSIKNSANNNNNAINNNNNYSDSYSDLKSIDIKNIGEERVNSIYGIDELVNASSDCTLNVNQLDTNYHQLSRASSVNMKNNSIYESN